MAGELYTISIDLALRAFAIEYRLAMPCRYLAQKSVGLKREEIVAMRQVPL